MKSWKLLAGSFVLSATLLFGCAQEPRKPTDYAKALAEATNPQADEEISDFILATYGGRFHAPRIEAYVDRIAKKLVPIAALEASDIEITLVNSGEITASVHQGGEILISRGMLGLADTEAEVAAVLAHELAHLSADHHTQGNPDVVAARRALEADMPPWLVEMTFGKETYEQSADGALRASTVRRFSHEQEHEADQLAVRYLAQAGYEPQAVVDLLQRFYAFHRALGYGEDFETNANGWLDTHPTTSERIDRLVSFVDSLPTATQESGRDRHLDAIDGLLWGEDPQLGSQEGTVYVHPGLGVRFDVPLGFTSNGTREAYLGHDRFTRVIRVELASEDLDADIEAFDAVRDAHIERFEGPPFPVTSIHFPFRTLDVDLFVMFAQVEIRPETYIRFEIMHFAEMTETDIQQYHHIIRNLRLLSAEESAAQEMLRIATAEIDVEQSFGSWAASRGMDRKSKDVIAILNGVDQNATLVPGQRMKIIAHISQ